jgi:hypothetical protein
MAVNSCVAVPSICQFKPAARYLSILLVFALGVSVGFTVCAKRE